MTKLRQLSRHRTGLAAVILVLALALRVLVPTGFMPMADHGRWIVTICTGAGPMDAAMAMPGMAHHDDGKLAKPCAFADLALPAIAGADPIQLAAAILFILALGPTIRVAMPIATRARLRPPLRGPPLTS